MKSVLIILCSLFAATAFADGFRCEGGNYSVKQYNQTKRERGIKNPSVLIVSEKGIGTIAVLRANSEATLYKLTNKSTVQYFGSTHHEQNGRFIGIQLEINKKPIGVKASSSDIYEAVLTVNEDNLNQVETVYCERYRKSDSR